MKKSRKSFLLAMMAILVAAGLAGCGSHQGINDFMSRMPGAVCSGHFAV